MGRREGRELDGVLHGTRHLPAAGNTRVPPPTLHVKDVAQGAEMGAQLGSSVAFGSYSGKALPGVPRKAPLCSYSPWPMDRSTRREDFPG